MTLSSSFLSPFPRWQTIGPPLALAVALSCLPGCGGDDPAPPAGNLAGAGGGGGQAGAGGQGGAVVSTTPGPLAGLPDDFCDRLLDKLAADLVFCGYRGKLDRSRIIAETFGQCRGFARTMSKAITRGDATFDAAVFAAATAGPPGDLCQRYQARPLYRGMFVGSVAEGQRCDIGGIDVDARVPRFFDDTCKPGTRCEEPDDACGSLRCVRELGLGEPCAVGEARCVEGLVCRGGVSPVATCQPPAAEGDACDENIDCLTDQWPGVYGSRVDCVGSTGKKTCQGPQPNGAACAPVADCSSCTAAERCVGQACVGGVCTDAAPLGTACKDKPEVCGHPSRCIVDEAHPAGACLAIARHGDPCSSDGVCGQDLKCLQGVCDTGAPLGAKCSAGTCGIGLFCLESACVPRPVVGETCMPDDDRCDLGSWCDPATRLCRLPAGRAGAACDPSLARSCEKGLLCNKNKVCVELGWIGDACASADECDLIESGTCDGGVCRDTCGAAGAGGAGGGPSTLPPIFAESCDAGVSVCKTCAATWKREPAFTDELLIGIAGTGGTDLWAISQQSAFHFDGAAWTKKATFEGELLTIVAGAPNEVYVARKNQLSVAIAHWDGSAWTDLPQAPSSYANANVELSLVGAGDLWLGTSEGVSRYRPTSGWTDTGFETYVVDAFVAHTATDAWILSGDLFRYNGAVWVNQGDPYLSNSILHTRPDGTLIAAGNFGGVGTWDGSSFKLRYCDYGDSREYLTALASNTEETIAVGVLQPEEGVERPVIQSLEDGKGLSTILPFEGGLYSVWGDDTSGFWAVGASGLVVHRAP